MYKDPSKYYLAEDDCKELVEQLNKCHENHPIGKLLGYCTSTSNEVHKCLSKQRKLRQREGYKNEQKEAMEKFEKPGIMKS